MQLSIKAAESHVDRSIENSIDFIKKQMFWELIDCLKLQKNFLFFKISQKGKNFKNFNIFQLMKFMVTKENK
ncbi:MAG: hypothetical protein CM15mP13_0680 [Pseudomonadota bacterium]|nr:MAG: hypothetical protein CM15mP13_0680 [Pseudomonadota bacterium]